MILLSDSGRVYMTVCSLHSIGNDVEFVCQLLDAMLVLNLRLDWLSKCFQSSTIAEACLEQVSVQA